jgi:hypothetical protein
LERTGGEVRLKTLTGKTAAVIGGGFFGCEAALKLAEYGCSVTLYEKESGLMNGASSVNQNRLHMGYHYPRSIATAKSSKIFQQMFRDKYPGAVFGNFNHYYAIAKGSKVTPDQYMAFCDEVGLGYIKEYPAIEMNNIDFCCRVPEVLFDTTLLSREVNYRIVQAPLIDVLCDSPVYDIEQNFRDWTINGERYDYVISAAYSQINKVIHNFCLFENKYQYELCEVPLIRIPALHGIGIGIMDGAYFGVLPVDSTNELYRLWDVELSVRHRNIGYLPDSKEVDPTPFKKYTEKAAEYIPAMAKAELVRYEYITKITLPEQDADDARPTDVIDDGGGFYTIFSGKVCAAIPAAETLVQKILRDL